MRIAITSLGETVESPMDERFERARFFVLYDLESEEWTVHENTHDAGSAPGAGVQAVRRVADLGAEAVITGHCGPKALAALAATGIDVCQEVSGSIREAVDAYRAGLPNKE
jgi:predicted Fe-Mo cluster-binding NifX family protein